MNLGLGETVCNRLSLELGAPNAAGGGRGGGRSSVSGGQFLCSDEPFPANSVKIFYFLFLLEKKVVLAFIRKGQKGITGWVRIRPWYDFLLPFSLVSP